MLLTVRDVLRPATLPWLFIVLFLYPSPSASGGCEFSISASDQDPYVNMSPPTDGPRNLYLWATCVEDGLAAFELGFTGTLNVWGFNPMNGVMNAGTATDLMLAIPGCPYGQSLDLVLGFWVVNDDGGSACLGASSSGLIGAVDCNQVDPGLTVDPIVRGFSSGLGAPCVLGASACSGEGGASSGGFGN